jgi:hypothetical protein
MQNPLPGVPLIDSPFFDRILSESIDDPEAARVARDLRQDGFAVLDFPDPEIGRLADHITARYAPTEAQLENWRAGRGEIRTQDAWRDDANVQRIAANARVLDILAKVYGRRAIPFQTLNFSVGTQQHVHSDSTHFSSIPDGFMCGIWVALEDIDADNGPLMYYPGSHRWPQFFNEHVGVNAWHQSPRGAHAHHYDTLLDELIATYGASPARFTARKGQAIIWHARLIHGGDTQKDKTRTRHSQVTHYYFENSSYYTPLYSDPFYGNIFFRHITDVSTGKPVPNMVSGKPVPAWFLNQAQHHGPIGWARYALSRLKRKVLGQS